MDYRKYKFSRKELAGNLGLFLLLAAAFSYLFYRSPIAFVLCLPLFKMFLKIRRESCMKKRQREFSAQFLAGMQSVSVALSAGCSVENAFGEALRELRQLYEEDAMIVREFRYIVVQLGMNRSLEQLLAGLAVRSGIEDIRNFADIFSAAKRTGGNLIAIIRNTVQCISQKEETRREINTCLSAKRLEQNIMSIVPCMILVYVQMVSPGFLDVMYHNPAGILIMSICLLVYFLAWLWGRKIVSIEV